MIETKTKIINENKILLSVETISELVSLAIYFKELFIAPGLRENQLIERKTFQLNFAQVSTITAKKILFEETSFLITAIHQTIQEETRRN